MCVLFFLFFVLDSYNYILTTSVYLFFSVQLICETI